MMLPHKEIVLPEVDLSLDDDPPGHYAEYWRLCFAEAWAESVARFEADPDDVHAAWWYIDGHPVFWQFNQPRPDEYPRNHISRLEAEGALTHMSRDGAMRRGWPEIIPFRDDNGIAWGYEFGKRTLFEVSYPPFSDIPVFDVWHDWKLDGWEKTYELAVIAIAKKIHENYGNDRRVVDGEEWRKGGGDGEEGDVAEP